MVGIVLLWEIPHLFGDKTELMQGILSLSSLIATSCLALSAHVRGSKLVTSPALDSAGEGLELISYIYRVYYFYKIWKMLNLKIYLASVVSDKRMWSFRKIDFYLAGGQGEEGKSDFYEIQQKWKKNYFVLNQIFGHHLPPVSAIQMKWTCPWTPEWAPGGTWPRKCWTRASTRTTSSPTSWRTSIALAWSSGRWLGAASQEVGMEGVFPVRFASSSFRK